MSESALRAEIGNSLTAIFDGLLEYEIDSVDRITGKTLTLNEMHTLSAIAQGEVSTMTMVAGLLGVTVSTLTIGINRLVVKGYVNRIRSQNDKRVVFLALTAKGEEAVLAHGAFHESLMQRLLQDLDAGKIVILRDMLKNIERAIQSEE